MYRFLETIRFEDGAFQLPELHQARLEQTFATFFPNHNPLKLLKCLPHLDLHGTYKFRFVYDQTGFQISYEPYKVKRIESISIVHSALDYPFKFSDRAAFAHLLQSVPSDEIIIVKNGRITDASYANLAFYDGNTWYTPREPLLHGVMRTHLLRKGLIQLRDIYPDDLHTFQKVSLINAMLNLGHVTFPTAQITSRP